MSSYQSVSSEALNAETMTLLKQQMAKLKLLSSELDLKSHQYQLLKETVRSIEQEKDSIEQDNQKLKSDIITVILHNQQYQRLLEEKIALVPETQLNQERLTMRINTLEVQEETSKSRVAELEEMLGGQMLENGELNKKLDQLKQRVDGLNITVSQLQGDKAKLKESSKKLAQQISVVAAKLQVSESEYSLAVDQLRHSKSRVESLTDQLQKQAKLLEANKQTIKGLSQRESRLLVVKEEYSQSQKSVERMRKQLLKIQRQHIKVQQDNLRLRVQKATCQDNTKFDIELLTDVLQTHHESGEYLSLHGDKLRTIARHIIDLSQESIRVTRQAELLKDRLHQSQLQVKQGQARCQCLQRELQIQSSRAKNAERNLTDKFNALTVSTSVRMKAKESQLEQISKRCAQLAQGSAQLQHTSRLAQEKDGAISELTQTNTDLKSALEEMFVQCEEGISSQKKANTLKYIVANLARHLFFTLRELKHALVFKQYFKVYYQKWLDIQKSHSPSMSITRSRFKVAAHVVRASLRMKGSLNKYNFDQDQSLRTKDTLLNKLVTRSIALDENQITAPFVKDLSAVLETDQTENYLVARILELFSKTYHYQECQYLCISVVNRNDGSPGVGASKKTN